MSLIYPLYSRRDRLSCTLALYSYRYRHSLGDFLGLVKHASTSALIQSSHLYFLSCLWFLAFTAVPAAANLKAASFCSVWCTKKNLDCCVHFLFFFGLSVGSVYLLRCVEASEAVGDFEWRHLEQPPYIQAWVPAGSMALYLLHVCPRWVSIGRPFRYHNYMMETRVSGCSHFTTQYHGPAVNIS